MAKRLFDTNAILTDCTDISNVLISSKTLEELENIKSSSHKDNDIKYKLVPTHPYSLTGRIFRYYIHSFLILCK